MSWAILALLTVVAWTGDRWFALGAAAVAYLLSVQIHPWARCWKCRGNPKIWDADKKNFRHCYACKGSGKRRRLAAIRWIRE